MWAWGALYTSRHRFDIVETQFVLSITNPTALPYLEKASITITVERKEDQQSIGYYYLQDSEDGASKREGALGNGSPLPGTSLTFAVCILLPRPRLALSTAQSFGRDGYQMEKQLNERHFTARHTIFHDEVVIKEPVDGYEIEATRQVHTRLRSRETSVRQLKGCLKHAWLTLSGQRT